MKEEREVPEVMNLEADLRTDALAKQSKCQDRYFDDCSDWEETNSLQI